MSERIVNDPSQHGWVLENGKWVWGASGGSGGGGSIADGDTEGQITTWSGTEWTPEGGVVVSGGNVGIGVPSPARVLQTDGSQVDFSRSGKKLEINPNSGNADTHSTIMTSAGMGLSFDQSNFGTMMHIDADGNVGVGTDSPSGINGVSTRRSLHINNTGEPISGVKITNSSSTNYANPVASGFEIATNADRALLLNREPGSMEFFTNNTQRMVIDANGNVTVPVCGLDISSTGLELNADRWVYSYNGGTSGQVRSGIQFKGSTASIDFCAGQAVRMTLDQNGRVDITGSLYVNGSEVGSGGGDYVPLTGNSTVNGTITATDFIATSDERLKEDITPLPVGLIDDIKPVQWNWKDGSGKSAGVIAQQLQAIGLDDFVNEDADGNLGVNYNALVGVLLAEVISLKAEVESLK